ncbi:MAG: hypothetical protein ABIR33_03555, partial [Pyrinomonadaceae bacterium]
MKNETIKDALRKYVLLSLIMIAGMSTGLSVQGQTTDSDRNLVSADTTAVKYGFIKVDGLNIAYREAGNPANPKVVLLHGFPAAS